VVEDENFPRAGVAAREGLHAGFAFPVRLGGQTVGVVEFFSRGIRQPDHDLLRMFATVGGQMGQFMERKEAEEALRRSEERSRRQLLELEALYQTAPVGLALVDTDLRFVRINDTLAEINGVPVGRTLGRTVREVIPQIADTVESAYRQVLETGEPVLDFKVHGTTSGQPDVERDWVVSYYPLKDPGGRVSGVNCIVEDVTERNQSEEALRQSEARLSLALSAAGMTAWETDLKTGHTIGSESSEQLWGVRSGNVEEYTEQIHPDDLPSLMQVWKEAVERAGEYAAEYRVRRPDGERWYLSRGQVVVGQDGRPKKLLGVTVDVTPQKATEEALREADRRKDHFLAMLGHELRNPLAGIRNSLYLMKLRGTNDPVVRDAQDIAQRQTDLLARLVGDLVEGARVTSDKIELRKEPVDLTTVVNQAIEAVRPNLDARANQVSVALPPEPTHLLADPARLAQILTNLLNNAAKFTGPGGRVELSAERAGEEVLLRVKDNGIGISPELLPTIFDLFVQGDTSLDRSQGGLGIGLTLVKKLVGLHGGHVTASSPGLGQGSEFVVHLPALPAPPPKDLVGIGEPALKKGGGHRLLVVDDNADGAESLAMMLRLSGYEVRVAYDGPAALKLAAAWLPEAVLCDIGMPGMDGYEVGRRLRQLPGLESALLLALTGYGEPEQKERAREAGFAAHLVKPVDLNALYKALAELSRHTSGSSPPARSRSPASGAGKRS
jgi:PAS domain S-box-containing protein